MNILCATIDIVMKKALLWIGILFLIYLAFIAFLFLFQEKLLFFPRATTDDRWKVLIEEELKADYVSIRADDGVVLEGMFLSDHSGEPRPTILFFTGNGTIVEDIASLFARFPKEGINVLLMDYRGYGLSTGEPDTEWMKRDAEKIYTAAVSHPHVDKDHIIVWGMSLGTGIATHLASVKQIEKVILFSPFTSLEDVAAESLHLIPQSIIHLLLLHKLDNVALAPSLQQPALIIHGENDARIRKEHAEKVAEAWGGPAELFLIPQRGHNDLWESEEMWEKVSEFLASKTL